MIKSCAAALAALLLACQPMQSPSAQGWLLGGPDSFDPLHPSNIYKVRPDGSVKTFLTTGTQGIRMSPSWSFDGARVAYSCAGPAGMQLCLMNADGTGGVTLPVLGLIPTFSPDRQKLVYQTMTDPSEVGIVSIDGTGAATLTHTTVGSTTRNGGRVIGSGAASLSPDATKILYTSSQSGRNQLWVMAPDGSNQRQLTFPENLSAPDANAARWSPDGTKIVAFRGFETEYGNVEIMNADGSGRHQVSNCVDVGNAGRSANCDSPTWAPDGLRVIFQSDMAPDGLGMRDPIGMIRTWIVNIDGSGLAVLAAPALNYGARGWTN